MCGDMEGLNIFDTLFLDEHTVPNTLWQVLHVTFVTCN